MSLIAGRIAELKTTLTAQNEMITTLRSEKNLTRTAIVSLYQAMVQYKPEFAANKTQIESSDYPDLRHEDLTRITVPELVKKFGEVMRTLSSSLSETREEVSMILREFDNEVESAMDQWNNIRISAENEKKSETFRAGVVSAAAATRAKTPDLVAAGPRTDFGPSLPPTPPTAPGQKEPIKSTGAGKPKVGTTTIGQLTSPTAGSAPRDDKAKTQNKGGK